MEMTKTNLKIRQIVAAPAGTCAACIMIDKALGKGWLYLDPVFVWVWYEWVDGRETVEGIEGRVNSGCLELCPPCESQFLGYFNTNDEHVDTFTENAKEYCRINGVEFCGVQHP